MIRWAAIATLIITTAGFAGCSMCCGPYDFDYPTYGGIHQRANPSQGRVGSVFSDPLYTINGPSADSNLKDHPEPRQPLDETEDEAEDDIDRADEDLDDDLEGLDERALDLEMDELDRELKELDLENDLDDDFDGLDDDLESIEPLEDVNYRVPETGNAALKRWRRRVALPKRTLQRR